jgi:fructose 1,6-bisphosphatase
MVCLKRAADIGYYRNRQKDISQLSRPEQVAALCLRPVAFPFTERKSEPILIAKLINATAGGFNRMLFNLFFHPALKTGYLSEMELPKSAPLDNGESAERLKTYRACIEQMSD